MLSAIIVDDEKSAIESLKWEIENFTTDVKVVDTFTNPQEAISAINYLKPDIVFLDIEMPELDGFQMLQKLTFRTFNLIITTAYNQYAIQAFKENAIDYLLKPIDPDELVKALQKAIHNRDFTVDSSNIDKIFNRIMHDNLPNQVKRIPLALAEKVVMVSDTDIVYCKSDGNYTHVILKEGTKYLLSKNIKTVFAMLPDNRFLRVHKSYVVNIDYISEYIRGDGGELILSNKKSIPVSRSHKADLLTMLNI